MSSFSNPSSAEQELKRAWIWFKQFSAFHRRAADRGLRLGGRIVSARWALCGWFFGDVVGGCGDKLAEQFGDYGLVRWVWGVSEVVCGFCVGPSGLGGFFVLVTGGLHHRHWLCRPVGPGGGWFWGAWLEVVVANWRSNLASMGGLSEGAVCCLFKPNHLRSTIETIPSFNGKRGMPDEFQSL